MKFGIRPGIALQIAAVWAACSAASATEYTIRIDGHCDRLKFTVVRSRLVGVSDGTLNGQPCDNDMLSGTVATTAAPVTPTGTIATAATSLGQQAAPGEQTPQFTFYIDLTHGTYTLYGTNDGNAIFATSGTWSKIGGAAKTVGADGKAGENRISDRFFTTAVRVKTN